MPLYNPPYAPPIKYQFIDGASFHAAIYDLSDRYLGGDRPAISWPQVASGARKTFFYDAIPVIQPGEDEGVYAQRIAPKRAELTAIERQPAFHVRTGDARRRRRNGNEQKMVDVHLAVDALLMASRGLFSSAVLVTSDLDFRPLVSALVDLGVDVDLWYQPGHTNSELIEAADRATPIDIHAYRQWVPTASSRFPTAGYEFREPREAAPPDAILQWQDHAGFGACFVSPHPAGVRLSCEAAPTTAEHRLTATSPNLVVLRQYCSDIFGLAIP